MRFEPNNEFNSVLFHLSSLSNCSFCSSFLSSSFFLWFLLNGIFATTILLFTPARVCNSFQVCVGRKNIFTPLPEFNPVGKGEAPPPPHKKIFLQDYWKNRHDFNLADCTRNNLRRPKVPNFFIPPTLPRQHNCMYWGINRWAYFWGKSTFVKKSFIEKREVGLFLRVGYAHLVSLALFT